MNDKFYFSLLLHAHLPYVHHPEHPSYLEENWLFEAISETYIPLLQFLEHLERDKVRCRLAISLSPPLLAMLDHPNLQLRYLDYLNRQSSLCQSLLHYWQCSEAEKNVLHDYLKFYRHSSELFQFHYGRNLILAFRRYRDKGFLELLCTSATHAFLPNFQQYPGLVRQQIHLAVATYEKYFGKNDSLGFWLPECGYYNGLDKILLRAGVRYCYIALHGLLGNGVLPQNGSFAPIKSSAGLIFFPRERASSAIIWDQRIGYPGSKTYRDFYQDVGYKVDLNLLRQHLPFDLRYYTGIKLWRIEKQYGARGQSPCVYEAGRAQILAAKHARNFFEHLSAHSQKAAKLMPRAPLISTVYDAELFGHWWNEGPQFLEQLFRYSHQQQKSGNSRMEFVTPSEYLQKENNFQTLSPCFSSWGKDGYAQVWLDQQNDWLYPQIFELYENIAALLTHKPPSNNGIFQDYGPYQKLALKQLIREFNLSCASDWAFMMKSDTSKDYAIVRANEHIKNTIEILQGFASKKFDNAWINQLQYKNRIFIGLDLKTFFL